MSLIPEKNRRRVNPSLPYNWRLHVVKQLKEQNIIISSKGVYDICSKGCSNPALEDQVLAAVKVVKKNYRKSKRKQQLLKDATLS